MNNLSKRPPGPVVPGWTRAITALSPVRLSFDSLAYLDQNVRKFGSFFGIYLGDSATYIVTDPKLAHEILVERHAEFQKSQLLRDAVGGLLGNGLLTSEGDFWRRQRKLAQPAFHARRVEAYADAMVRITREHVAGWRAGETRDIAHDMMVITLGIVCKTLFDMDVRNKANRVGELTHVILESANDRLNAYMPVWERLFKTRQRREEAAMRELFGIVDAIIAEHRAHGADTGDLLSMLLAARDDDGQPMSEQQLRDEVVTLFIAGHETTANLVAWALALLAQHPEADARMRAELAAIDGRAPAMADLALLPYGEQVLKEAMRLYPPAGGATRENLAPIDLGGYHFPARSQFAVSTYSMHRDAALFPDPLRFDPDRFSPENEPKIPKHAYLPFGGGPRVCIGNAFAMMEARLMLACIVQRHRLSLPPGATVRAEQLFTIRPKGGLKMEVGGR